MIYRFQPFSPQKELGKVYNGHCKLVPNQSDWIQLMDYDSMILTPFTFQIIEQAIMKYPDTAVFGCMTNRVGYPYQRLNKLPDENDSIRHHMEISHELAAKYPNGECNEAYSIAGFFLLFRKQYWQDNHFQDNLINKEGLFFDRVFCQKAKDKHLPLRVIKGAYIWHSYRLTKEWTDYSHLEAVANGQ